MRFLSKSGIGTAVIAVIVIVIIVVAAAGAYLAFYHVTTSTTTTSSTSSSSSTSTTTPISTTPYTIAAQSPAGGPGGLSVLLAQQHGILQQNDPNAKFVPIASPAAMVQSLIAGTSDIIVDGATNVIGAYAGGSHNITIIGSALDNLPFSLIVSSTSNYTSISQLKNALFASQAPTGFTSILLHQMAQEQGWPSINTVTLQSATATITAVIAGKADATLVDDGTLSTFLGTGLIRVVANITNSLIPNQAIVTTPAFLKAHPDAVKAAVASIEAGGMIYDENQSATVSFVLLQFPSMSTAGAENLVSLVRFSTDGSFTLAQLQTTINILYTYKAITTNVTASSLVSQGFAQINS